MTIKDAISYHYIVPGDDFTRAGEASSNLKSTLKKLGIPSQIIRKIAIAMYEGEINMVIHARGGTIDAFIFPQYVEMILKDVGPGIPDIEAAMQSGFSTATQQVRNLGFGAGMGLPNMKKYTDFMELDTELNVGTTVLMRVNIE